jgi:hypothetical protein
MTEMSDVTVSGPAGSPVWGPLVDAWLAANPISAIDQNLVKNAVFGYMVSTNGKVPGSVADFLTWARANKCLIDVTGSDGVVHKDVWVQPTSSLLDGPNVKLVIGAVVVLAFLLLRSSKR